MTGDNATRRINNRTAWTADEDERLRQLVISNASLSDIAEDLGRTASTVRERAPCNADCPRALALYHDEEGKMIQPRRQSRLKAKGK
jgi:hypothetical protein